MGKIINIFALLVFSSNLTFSQEWQTISHEQFSCPCPWIGGFSSSFKGFNINPYTNDLWSTYDGKIYRLTNEGEHIEYNNQNTPAFIISNSFAEFVFTSNIVYAARYSSGIYKFENEAWSLVLGQFSPRNLSADGDTVWTSDDAYDEYYRITPLNIEERVSLKFKRSQHRNGHFWGSASEDYFIFKVHNDSFRSYYLADTCKLLNNTNYDFKFSKKTDSLYVAGTQGISIAYGNQFIDSIDIYSSINMPNSGILEFEFDQHDNIWAVFGEIAPNPNFTIPHSIGYYEQATRTWTQIYDANNSPIDFTNEFTIEVDTAGNLWVAQGLFLHVLKINNPPIWLNTTKLEKEKNISIYPNPANDILNFQNKGNQIKKLEILDLSGKLILEKSNFSIDENKIDISSIRRGFYMIRFEGENEMITLKFQKL